MRRRGSMPFVVEIKSSRKRFAPGIPAPALLEKRSPGFHVNGADALFSVPGNGSERNGEPSIEDARLAADRLFGGPGASPSSRARDDQQTNGKAAPADQAVMAVGSREDAPVERPTPEVQASAPDAKPRTGRILESLTSKDPMEALFRQRAEEEATPRRGRPPGSRNLPHVNEQAAGERQRDRIPTRSAADVSPSPGASGTAGLSATGESQAGDLHPPIAKIDRGKSRRDAQRPARRRKPTSRTRASNARRPGKPRAAAKRNVGIGVARKATDKNSAGRERPRTKSVVRSGAAKRTVRAKRGDRSKGTKQRARAPMKAAVRQKAVTKRARGGGTARNTVVRNSAVRKPARGKTSSPRKVPAKNALKAKKPLRAATSRKTASRKGSPARRRTSR